MKTIAVYALLIFALQVLAQSPTPVGNTELIPGLPDIDGKSVLAFCLCVLGWGLVMWSGLSATEGEITIVKKEGDKEHGRE